MAKSTAGSRRSGGSWRTSSPKTRHGRRTKTRKAELEVLEEQGVCSQGRMALVKTMEVETEAEPTDWVTSEGRMELVKAMEAETEAEPTAWVTREVEAPGKSMGLQATMMEAS